MGKIAEGQTGEVKEIQTVKKKQHNFAGEAVLFTVERHVRHAARV